MITGTERSLCVTAWRMDTYSCCKARLRMITEGPDLMLTGIVKTALLRAPEAHTLWRHLFGHVGCCSIHNSQEKGPAEMSISRRVDKKNVTRWNSTWLLIKMKL